MSSPPPKPISIQLFTLRAEAEKDFPAVLRRLAAIGYRGVEPAGFYNFSPGSFRAFVEDLGLVISSTHSPWARPDNLEEVIDVCGILGVKMVAGGFGPAEFETIDAIQKTAEETAMMHAKLKSAGLTLVIHNHAWEFEKIDGSIKHEIFAELCPDVMFELDTYWTANFGENNAPEMMRRFANRSPLLHIKDGPLIRHQACYDAALLPVGDGKNDIRGIIAAMNPAVTRWLVVEQDTSDTDMLTCVERSYRFLTSNGLAAGNR